AVQLDTLNLTEKPEFLNQPLFVQVTTKELRDAYKKIKEDPEMEYQIEWQKDGRVNDKTSFKKIFEAGIPIFAGSDASNYGSFQGFSLHRELELFVENGMPAWEALRSTTIGPERFFGRPGGFENGALANFVVLKSNPIEKIKATQEIEDVFYRGVKVDRPALLKASFSHNDSNSASNGK
ncbi:MAG: amidohydrolase family protein, partial [Bdellovibrionia bacterium]